MKPTRIALLAGLLAAAVTPAAPAAPALAALASAIPSALPRSARPSHYRIAIVPDPAALTFAGRVEIDLEVLWTAPAIVLHAADLKIASAVLTGPDGKSVPLTARLNAAAQTVRFTPGTAIPAGRYKLSAIYSGVINTQANGLFALDYADISGKTTRALFTQFEAADARRLAPMFDEPIYKATFDLSVTVPEGQLAIGNMPIARERVLGGGRKEVTFATSPKMSSYLLFFASGDFERISRRLDNGVEIGVVAPRGSAAQGRLALDELAPVVPWYAEYFGQPYPLPKLDNVAGPGQSQFFGAMENWGAIFTFQRGLLNDPAITSPERRKYIVATQNHEVAHQWFGDLVTMAWWDDLWLNEGFASWMETKATDHFHPDWFALLSRVGGREGAMDQDALRTTHPVVQRIRTVEEASQAFDGITYDKGEAVIAMLEAYAGADVWRAGLRSYMAQHKFDNTRTEDLWRAIEQAGAPGLPAIARDFTVQPGIPLVRVGQPRCVAGQTILPLRQGEYRRDPAGRTAAALRWRVPVLAATAGSAPVRTILQGKGELALPGCGPVIVNAGQLGYYRTLYPAVMLDALRRALPTLAPIDQMGLVADQLELSRSAMQPMAAGLDLLAAIPGDANPVVARRAISELASLHDRLGEDRAARSRLAALASARWTPRLQTLGLEPDDRDMLPDAELRAELIASLGAMGNADLIAAARRRFAALDRDPRALDGPLRITWLTIIAREATAAEWERLAALAGAATSPVERAELFTLLGAARDPALARRTLALALTDAPGKTTSAAMIARTARGHALQAFDFVAANRARVDSLVDVSGRARFIQRLAIGADDPAMIARLSAYAAKLAPDARKPLSAALAQVRYQVAANPRITRETAAWLNTQQP